MKLILTRHGETIENKNGIIQGQLSGSLSELGKLQAKKLAQRLKNEKIDAIYSSDLARAADTTKEIAKFHPNTPVHFVKELRERNLGMFQGKNVSEIEWSEDAEGMETHKSVRQRGKKILDKAYAEYPDKTVLFVAHGGFNTRLFEVIERKTYSKKEFDKKLSDQTNTNLSIFEIREDKNHKVHLLNCVKHLE